MEKFEDLLNELNEVVKELESGTLSLEESIQKYEKGIELSKKCKDKLLLAKEVVLAKINTLKIDKARSSFFILCNFSAKVFHCEAEFVNF